MCGVDALALATTQMDALAMHALAGIPQMDALALHALAGFTLARQARIHQLPPTLCHGPSPEHQPLPIQQAIP